MLEHLHPLVAQPILIHHLPLLGDLIRAQWQLYYKIGNGVSNT
jgi:hypothetical protein